MIPLKDHCSDASFIKQYNLIETFLEFTGFNAKDLLEAGVSLRLNSRVIYQPLISNKPSDPSKILTTSHEAEKSRPNNQNFYIK